MAREAGTVLRDASARLVAKEQLSARTTPELVIGLVGPIASGVTTTGSLLQGILTNDYGYEVEYQTVSSIIRANADLVGQTINEGLTFDQRISEYQEVGNKLREKLGAGYLAAKCVEAVNFRRLQSGMEKRDGNDSPDQPIRRRVAHIIDSIKNPAEVEQLQQVYGRMFWLFAIFAPEDVRKSRLLNIGCAQSSLDKVILRDQDEDKDYGQKVRDTIEKADFFLRNDRPNDSALKQNVSRCLEILFHYTILTPTVDECAMYDAQAAAANSACMSRQVGAAIYSAAGNLISVGWNDVPKTKGGLYRESDGDNDHRCFKWGGKLCHNDSSKKKIRDELFRVLDAEVSAKWQRLIKKLVADVRAKESSDKKFWQAVQLEVALLEKAGGLDMESLEKASKISGIDGLIEFSRAVHAEMEAIISALRTGHSDLTGATLYCTTFPCHSCARHIVASGITRVVYIEPYPKSKAHELHNDAISLDEASSSGDKVVFVQYDGVAPKNMLALFKSGTRRKEKSSGKLVERSKKSIDPLFTPAMDGFAANEFLLVRELTEREARLKGQ